MLYLLLMLFIICACYFGYLTIKFKNPYKLVFIFGKKGAGKTTYLTKKAYYYRKRGVTVYCNTEIPGTFLIDAKDIGHFKFQENSVIMIDEVSLLWDNRNFKSFDPAVQKFFRLQRHHKLRVYLFSQTFDVDKKVRDLTDSMFMLSNHFGWMSYCKEIRRKLVVVKPSEESESRIADELVIPPWWLAIFGTREFIYVPRWIKYFDSHLIEEPLPEKDYKWQPYKEGMDPYAVKKSKKSHQKDQDRTRLESDGLSRDGGSISN